MTRGPRHFAMRFCIALADFVAAEAIATSTRLTRALEMTRRQASLESETSKQAEARKRAAKMQMN